MKLEEILKEGGINPSPRQPCGRIPLQILFAGVCVDPDRQVRITGIPETSEDKVAQTLILYRRLLEGPQKLIVYASHWCSSCPENR